MTANSSIPSFFSNQYAKLVYILSDNPGSYHMSTLYELFPEMAKSSVRRLMQRAVRDDIAERIKRGYYRVRNPEAYEEVSYTLRIRDTTVYKPQNSWEGVDAEATISGSAPAALPDGTIEDVLRPILIDNFLIGLSDLGVFLTDDSVSFDFEGLDRKGIFDDIYSRYWKVEILFTNQKYSSSYDEIRNVMIEEDEFS